MLTVVVERSKWYRGHGSRDSYLRRSLDDRMCCLGFAELADGASIEEITAVGEPCFVERKHGPEMMNLILETPNREDYPTKYASTSVAGQLMKANDSLDYRTGIERENEIIRLGKTVGIEFQFVD